VAKESRQPTNPQPESKTNLDFDPFASWALVHSRYEDRPCHNNLLSVNTRCPKRLFPCLESRFYIEIQDSKGLKVTEPEAYFTWFKKPESSGPFVYNFYMHGLRVYNFKKEEVLTVDLFCSEFPERSFHVGTLCCKVMETGGKWVMDSPV